MTDKLSADRLVQIVANGDFESRSMADELLDLRAESDELLYALKNIVARLEPVEHRGIVGLSSLSGAKKAIAAAESGD